MALLGLRDGIELHTFHPRELEADVTVNFEPLGIRVTVYPSTFRYMFQYLHPLARPSIAPSPNNEKASVEVEADEVLRFGCLEGDFRVTAKSAVYDPQSGAKLSPFGANGSRAERLAIVLNADEVCRLARDENIDAAAISVMRQEDAAAIVVKDGASGAYVFEGRAPPRHVPAYPTRSVYKIGSGDVFSATFAHAWLAGKFGATEAADLASRRTADYVETPAFPLPQTAGRRPPAPAKTGQRRVLLSSPASTTSGRWLREEAIRGIESLGSTVVLVEDTVGGASGSSVCEFDVVLIILQDRECVIDEVRVALAHGKPVIAFADTPEILDDAQYLSALTTDDLCSALYFTQWIPI
jgi:hypothetical protein